MKKVLLVEDDLILTMINKRYMELLGHKVVASARNGLDAIASAKKHNPDIILMDIRIEGDIDGIDAMQEIRKFSQAAVIYVTGNSDTATKKRAEKTNMLGFCIKPISFDDLKELLAI